jgi:hypothetical protein
LHRRRFFIAVLLAVACFDSDLTAETPIPHRDSEAERQALLDANALLQDEIKLAARPQTYLIIDVHHGIVLVKARGIEIHRLPLLFWRIRGDRPPAGLFRLEARPSVDRPKARPGEDATEHPVEVSDMPAEYQLTLEPSLVVAVGPPAQDHPWLWIRGLLREGWTRTVSSGSTAWLRITLPPESARSLAWLVTDGMPVLIGRSTFP